MSTVKFRPSAAKGWLACAQYLGDDTSSKYADEGTAAHFLASECLENGLNTTSALGHFIAVPADGPAFWAPDSVSPGAPIFTVDAEMAEAVGRYVAYVREVVKATNGTLLVEQKLDISGVTGEPGATGTSDVVILTADEIIVVDLKYGQGVEVKADNNPQLQVYALAAYQEHSLAQDFKQARMVIHQPRKYSVSEWTQTIEDLEMFGGYVKTRLRWHDAKPNDYSPSEDACRWCARRATCPGLASKVMLDVGADFEDLTKTAPLVPPTDDVDLAHAMAATPLIEVWIAAVRAEVERRLLAGTPVEGFKLVQGRKGSRTWANPAEAEAYLKTARCKLDEMYEFKLLTPPALEKRQTPWVDADGNTREPVLGPKQWKKVLDLVVQKDGGLSVAPVSDKRPEVKVQPTADDFDDISETADDLL